MGVFSLVIDNGLGGTLTFDNTTNATRVQSREYNHDVNYPGKLTFILENRRTTDTDNLLNDACTAWTSGATAIALGMEVVYSLVPNSLSTGLPGSLTEYFRGFITAIEQTSDGSLKITARDYLYCFEGLYIPKISYTNYRDYYSRDVGIIASGDYAYKLAFEGVDSTGYYPGVEIALLTDDYFFDYGCDIDGGGAGGADLTEGYAWAQAFIAEDVEILGILLQGNYTEDPSATDASVLRISIQEDDGADRPDGTKLFYKDVELTSTGAQWLWVYFDTTNHTFERLIPGKKYWVHVEHYSTDASYPGYWQHYINVDGGYCNSEPDAHFVYGSVPLDSGSTENEGNLFAFPLLAKVVPLRATDYTYYLDGATPKLAILSLPTSYPGLSSPPTILPEIPSSDDRGRLSYYYDTIEIRDIMSDIFLQEPDHNYPATIESDISRSVPVYKTNGKSLGECLRELCDVYGFYVSGDYYKTSMIHMYTGGAHGYYVGRRKDTASGAASCTFAYGDRILSARLERTAVGTPTVVRITGRGLDGEPIIVERDGRGATDAFITRSKHRVTKLISDSSLTTLEAVNSRAWAELDRFTADAWEGEIVLSGVYPNLIIRSSDYYGSGVIMNITYPIYGLDGVKFAVTGIDVGVNTTTVRLTNADRLTDSVQANTSRQLLRSDSFLSGVDDQTYRYLYVYQPTVNADLTLYMQLCQGNTAILDSHSNYTAHRVPCTLLTQPSGGTDYDTVVFRAEFAPENGYGTVERIELYTDATGGSEVAEWVFQYEIDNAAKFYKTKKTRVVVEFGL